MHYTTIGTLTKADNMLRAMFSGRMEVLTDTEGKSDRNKFVYIRGVVSALILAQKQLTRLRKTAKKCYEQYIKSVFVSF